MASRRSRIAMDREEQGHFLAGEPLAVLATIGPRGFPHTATVGFAIAGLHTVYMTSFANAQKVINVRRCDQASLLVERTLPYGEARGVRLRGTARLVETPEVVADWYVRIDQRTAPLLPPNDMPATYDSRLIAKRVLIVLEVERASSWDHRKLDGAY